MKRVFEVLSLKYTSGRWSVSDDMEEMLKSNRKYTFVYEASDKSIVLRYKGTDWRFHQDDVREYFSPEQIEKEKKRIAKEKKDKEDYRNGYNGIDIAEAIRNGSIG